MQGILQLSLLVDEQKELIRNLLFSSTNMAAITKRENHLLACVQLKLRNQVITIFNFIFVPSARRAQGTMLSCVRVRP